MIDAYLFPVQSRLLGPLASVVHRWGVSADHITLAGFFVGLLAAAALSFAQWELGLALILLNRFFDGLDGAIARIAGPTKRGAFLDIACDFIFYASVPLAFAINDPIANALPAAVLLGAFMGTGASFLAFSVIAAQEGRTAASYPQKGIFYLGGLTEGFETIFFFVAVCLWPTFFAPLAYIFAAACAITTISRLYQGWRSF